CHSFFPDPATPEIYTLSLHDALPICAKGGESFFFEAADGEDQAAQGDLAGHGDVGAGGLVEHEGREAGEHGGAGAGAVLGDRAGDRKSTRLNSSHLVISYAVFCLKKK